MRYIVSYSQKFLTHHILWYAVVLLLAVKIVSVVFYIPFPNNFFFADITKSSLTHLLNGQRQEMGLNTLTQSQKLDQAAALKAQDMVAKGYFAHQSPQGTTPWHWFSQVGYKYNYAGENLAVGFIDSPEVFYAWLNSPSHKANMVNPNYTEVGTAIVSGFEGNSLVVVQLFGTPKAAAVTSNPKSETPRPEGARLASPSGEVAQNPLVIVDYAHTPEQLEQVYASLLPKKLVCVLGSCGGGRDKWKRPVLGKIAAQYCREIIITNEDPYDEDPLEIMEQVAEGVGAALQGEPRPDGRENSYHIVLDRKEAIKKALELATPEDAVIITGKGAEPLMCLADGKKIPWDDRQIVRSLLSGKM